MKKQIKNRKLKGMTLTELLVVMAILGILILIAYPVLTPIFQKARSTEAKNNLVHLANLQKVYFLEHTRYSDDPGKVGFQQEALETEGGKAFYQIEITEASSSNFRASATSIADFDGDGIFNIWEIDKSGIPIEVVQD
ncbi:MAG: prepilin-type N-terminal cleavage/methylation domain-containing protein [Bacteroidia bacterium]